MKNPAAVALGKLGGKAGTGAAKERTSEQARAAVTARWAKTKRKPKRVARRSNEKGQRRRRRMSNYYCPDCGAVASKEPCENCGGKPPFAAPDGSVAALKQYVTSAWIEAECVCVAAQETGPVEILTIFKARDMLRDVLHVLNTAPPNADVSGVERKP